MYTFSVNCVEQTERESQTGLCCIRPFPYLKAEPINRLEVVVRRSEPNLEHLPNIFIKPKRPRKAPWQPQLILKTRKLEKGDWGKCGTQNFPIIQLSRHQSKREVINLNPPLWNYYPQNSFSSQTEQNRVLLQPRVQSLNKTKGTQHNNIGKYIRDVLLYLCFLEQSSSVVGVPMVPMPLFHLAKVKAKVKVREKVLFWLGMGQFCT